MGQIIASFVGGGQPSVCWVLPGSILSACELCLDGTSILTNTNPGCNRVARFLVTYSMSGTVSCLMRFRGS